MANQNFRVGVSIDLTQARASLRRLEQEFKEINVNFGDLRGAAKDIDALRRAVKRLDKEFDTINFQNIEVGFRRVAGAVQRLRATLFPGSHSVNEMSESLDRLSRNAHQAERAIDGLRRSQNQQVRAGRIGAGGRQAARSSGTPVGFAGRGLGGGFLGIGGIGARFAIGAGVIASVTALGFALAGAAAATGRLVADTAALSAEFDLLIRRANILAGGDAIGVFSDAALEQGKRTIFTANEAAGALGELARAGFNTEEAIAALPGVLDLAAADQLELADATLIVARTLRSFRLDAESATVVADVLAQTAASTATSTTELAQGLKFAAPFAAQLGVPLQEVAAAMGVLGDNGIVAGIAGRNLRFAFQSLVSPTAVAKDAMEELGLRTSTSAGNFVSFRNIIEQLVEAQEKLGSSAEFAGLVAEAFGVRAGGAILTLVENFENFETQTTENFQAFGRAAEIAEEQLAGLEGALERLRGEVESQQIESFNLTGLEDELAQFARELDQDMNAIFGALVDPIFSSIAEGANLLRNETLPEILLSLPSIGQNFAGIIDSVFDAVASNADTVATVIESISVAVQGLVNVFIGLGTVVAPAIDLIGSFFNSLPEGSSSALVGAFTGAGIGAFFGPVGAIVGGLSGFALGAIGAALEGSDLPRQAAEFGVNIGVTISQGIAEGIELSDAVDQALAASAEPGRLQADTFVELRNNITDTEDRIAALTEQLNPFEFGIWGQAAIDAADAAGLTSAEIEELGRELRDSKEDLAGAKAALDQLVKSAENAAVISASLAQAQEILNGLRARDPGLAADFFVIQDPAEILSNVFAGAPLAALGKRLNQDAAALVPIIGSVGSDLLEATRGGIVTPTDEAARLIEEHVATLTTQIADSFSAIATGLGDEKLRLLGELEGFKTVVENVIAGIGESFAIESIPQPGEFAAVSGIDFSAIFEPPSEDDAAKAAEEAAAAVEPTVRSTLNGLFDIIGEVSDQIGSDRAGHLRERVRGIFEVDGLTLGEQALAGAFLVDQAAAEAQAQALVDQLTSVFDRVEELAAQQAEVEPLFEVPANLAPDDAALARDFLADDVAARTQKLVEQQTVLLGLVDSGNFILANAAATSNTVLNSISGGFARVEELKLQAEGLLDRADVQIGVITDDEEVAAAQATIDQLAADVAEIGPSLAEGLEADLSGIPGALTDPFEEGVGNILEFAEIGSPSALFQRIGGFLVDGLSIGWASRFPSFNAQVISDFARLINTIESMFANLTLTTPSVSTPSVQPKNAFHSGGWVPGRGDVPATLLGGEFVLRRGAVESLMRHGIDPTLLNRDPSLVLHQSTTNARDYSKNPVSVNQNFEIHTTATRLNERRLMRDAENMLVRHAKKAF